MPELTGPVLLAGRRAPSRVLFGPHPTNLGAGRALGPRHGGYYERRARGGAGIVVTETASVTADDWPYERAPLAADCAAGWADVARRCRPHGALVLAGLGHAGAQGSSAYSQQVMWAPSAVADVVSRELPAVMEQPEIDGLLAGFRAAARGAVQAGLDGVEVDAGAFSLLRQFLSGLTNLREDEYGADRSLLLRQVLAAVRAELGAGRVLALRLCCDELAPWAGITPEQAEAHVDAVAGAVDLLVVVRGGPFSTSAYRPTGASGDGFNTGLAGRMRRAAAGRTLVALQGSVVEVAGAAAALREAVADLVEMTRAQIAEPDLVTLSRRGGAERIRPCVLCNQACQVRDPRNPVVSCIGEPAAGHETPDPAPATGPRVPVLVVGAGPAGLEAARMLAGRGHRVRVVDRGARPGGAALVAALLPGHERFALLAQWLAAQCLRAGAELVAGHDCTGGEIDEALDSGWRVLLATGSRPMPPAQRYGEPGLPVFEPAEVLSGAATLPPGAVLVHDPVGGPVGVGTAERLALGGHPVHLVSPDPVCGTLLAATGELSEVNVRLQQAGVVRELRSTVRAVRPGGVLLGDVHTGAEREVPCAAVVDAGHRLAEDSLHRGRPGPVLAGDAVAPRSVLQAVLEGRRAAESIAAGGPAR